MNRLFYLPLLILLSGYMQSHAQTDSLFWFAAPDVSPDVQNFDRPIKLIITTFNQPAVVTISQPAGGGMPVQTANIPANSTQTVTLTTWLNVIKTQPANTVLNYGLKIVSTAPVTVYYEVTSQNLNSPETFALKGQNALGTDFWIPSQNLIDNQPSRPDAFSSFDIVATENNTSVTITPSNAIVGHPAGISFNIVLNEGQTWSAKAMSKLAANHLGGSRVVSDKPIAITIKDDNVDGRPNYYGACADLIGDQIIPVHLLGTEYIAVNGFLNAPHDQLFILATQNGTTISQNGVVAATINAGQTHRAVIGGPSTYIQTSAPVYVLQLTGVGCEFGLGMLPQINCTGSSSVSYARFLPSQLYLNLVVRNGGQGDFLVNGNTGVINAANFAAVPGTGGQWMAAQVSLSIQQYPMGSVISVTNTSALFHLGILDANTLTAGGASYGYFSDFRQISINAAATAPELCAGMDLSLLADSIASANYSWTGPNGYASNQQSPVIQNVSVADSGMYIVTATSNGCIASDTVVLPVFYMPVADLGPDTANCGDTILLQSSPVYPDATYRWSTGASSHSLTVTQPGVYWLEIDNNGCTGSDTVNVTLNPALEVNLGNDTVICDVDVPLVLYAPQPPGTQYLWSTGFTDSQAAIYQTGTYWLYVNRDGCTGSDTIHVRVVQTPVISLGNDTVICESIPARIGRALPGATYSWNTGAATSHTEVSATGDYILSVNLEGCIVHDTIHITAMPDPSVDLGPDDDICPEQTIVLDAYMSGNNDYLWNTGDTTPDITVTSGGVYWVEVISEYGCTGRDSITLSHYPKPVVMLGQDTIVCEETPLLLHAWALNTDSVRWSDGSIGDMLSVKYGGEYIATGINKCGTGSDTIEVKQIFCEIWLPNAFTPNGDGVNDIFRILGNVGRMEGVSFGIYNRWGEEVFHTKDKYQGWGGDYKGVPSQMGTYVYLLEYSIDGRPYLQKGNFHLLR